MLDCLVVKSAVIVDYDKEKEKCGHDELFDRIMDRS